MGTILLILSLIFSLIALLSLINKKNNTIFKYLSLFSLLSTFFTFFYLVFLFISNAYIFHYVYIHSSNELPLFYKIAAAWSGQEGSLLLWALLSQIVSFFSLYNLQNNARVEKLLITLNNIFFQTALLTVSYPFAVLTNITDITNGKGLNPILQSPYMTIHPPITFAAYAIGFIIFIKTVTSQNISNILPYLRKCNIKFLTLLGIGIALGSLWSYSTLGWGGFWGWDPVENSSLLPWLISLISLHIAILFKYLRDSKFLKFYYIVNAIIYISIIFSALLTRSGILGDTSVHSFSKNGAQLPFTLYIIFLFIILAYSFIKTDFTSFENNNLKNSLKSDSLFYGISVLSIFSVSLLILTMLPIITQTTGEKIVPSNEVYIRTAAVTAIIIAISYILSQLHPIRKKTLLILGVCSIPGFFTVFLRYPDYLLMIVIFFSTTALFFTLRNIFLISKYQILQKLIHSLYFVFIIAISIINIGDSRKVIISQNEPFIFNNNQITFHSYEPDQKLLKISINNKKYSCKFFKNNNSVLTFPIVKKGIFSDIYIEPEDFYSGKEQLLFKTVFKDKDINIDNNTIINLQMIKLIKKDSHLEVTADFILKNGLHSYELSTGLTFIDKEVIEKKTVIPGTKREITLKKFSADQGAAIFEITPPSNAEIPSDRIKITVTEKFGAMFIKVSFYLFAIHLLLLLLWVYKNDRS